MQPRQGRPKSPVNNDIAGQNDGCVSTDGGKV